MVSEESSPRSVLGKDLKGQMSLNAEGKFFVASKDEKRSKNFTNCHKTYLTIDA